jgi:filamentous hemagglutinin
MLEAALFGPATVPATATSQCGPVTWKFGPTTQALDRLRRQAQALEQSDPDKSRALHTEADRWAEGGDYRVALHTATGALSGGLAGAAGAYAAAEAAPALDSLQADLKKEIANSLQQAGVSTDAASRVAGAISTLAINATGAALTIGSGSNAAAMALNIDANNRQLHPTEIRWIRDNAQRYAQMLGISEAEAEKRLAEQAFRQSQFGAEGGAAAWDTQASSFLKEAGRQSLPNGGYLFYATPDQRADATMYLDSAASNADFYARNGLQQPTAAQLQAAAQRDANLRANIGTATNTAAVASASLVLAGLAPTTLNWALANPVEASAAGIISAETAAAITSGAVNPTSLAPVLASRGVNAAMTAAAGEQASDDVAAALAVASGRVQSRINVANERTATTPLRPSSGEPVSAGFNHVVNGHFDQPLGANRSVFTIAPDDLKSILQSPSTVASPVTPLEGGQYMRIVDTRVVVGNTSLNEGGLPTTFIKVFTDAAGNLITTYPVRGPKG